MININPIPKHLLIHSIEYEEFVKEGSFGSVWAKPETIVNVLFQRKTELMVETNGTQYQTTGILFLDSKYTTPYKPLKVDSKIKFKEYDLVVIESAPMYTFDPDIPHHYEVKVL